MGRARDEYDKQQQMMADAKCRFDIEQDRKRLAWQVVLEVVDRIPLSPAFIHPSTAYPNTLAHIAFKLETVEDVRAWRETVATLMDELPPCAMIRHRSGALSFTPELSDRQRSHLEDSLVESHQVAPFYIRLEKYSDYQTMATVCWFHESSTCRVQVTVEIGTHLVGTELVGMRQDPMYEATGRGAGGRDTRRLIGHRAIFPFPTYRVDRFWGSGTDAKPAIAYWDLSCLPASCCAHGEGAAPYTLVQAGRAFLHLTEFSASHLSP